MFFFILYRCSIFTDIRWFRCFSFDWVLKPINKWVLAVKMVWKTFIKIHNWCAWMNWVSGFASEMILCCIVSCQYTINGLRYNNNWNYHELISSHHVFLVQNFLFIMVISYFLFRKILLFVVLLIDHFSIHFLKISF